ncbi:hypothetical protein PFISCL1PPCAC_15796, partial [Pristionchus fissidentatus]
MVNYSIALLLLASTAAAFDSTEIRMLQDESGSLIDAFGHPFGPIRLRELRSRHSQPSSGSELRTRRQTDRIREVLGSIRLVRMAPAPAVESIDDSSEGHVPDKRSAPLIRFGKRSINDEEMARTVRQDQGLGSPLIRFGKRSGPSEEEIMEDDGDLMERFGRAPASAPLIRFGKRSSTAPFVRFGRTASAPLIRFGKRS